MAGVGGNGLQFINDLQVEAPNAMDAESPGFFKASLSATEKEDYINAVQCLWDRHSEQTPGFSAAQNLYDDFVATHIQQADTIHSTGLFLTWHRLSIWTWECGYKGYLPYWNWYECPDDPAGSAVFDGSATSIGGDGAYFQHDGTLIADRFLLPSGKGGGCVESGPFANRTIHLRPLAPEMQGLGPVMTSIRDFNPRCLRRDLSVAPQAAFNDVGLQKLMKGNDSSTVGAFQAALQHHSSMSSSGEPSTLHNEGHYSLGGDATCSPSSYNDPAFYLHHAMVDRIYWVWQALHPEQALTVAGSAGPSREVVMEDLLEMGTVGASYRIKDMLDTLGGSPLCYVYV
ncbi:hypothetical protein PG996_004735 [Apiospora saccharicola]|uniref:Tyrosinase copper-binding domain-containing protein n=1 Tax=Apiospora saccharicola TaxID=335842 RepID=A0ABR1W4X4_9PEZI